MGEHYDIVIIGGGTGGLRASVIAAKSGFKTAVVEPGHIGGTCLNTGCIPTKTLLHAAKVYNLSQNCADLGIKAKSSCNFPQIMGRMRGIVETGRKHAEQSVHHLDNLTLIKGKAEFASDSSIKVHDKIISADKFVIATGARPWAPPMNGLDKVGFYTNEEALQLTKQPKTLIVVGGGYISLELASFFAGIGTKVVVLERMPKVLAMLDVEISEFMKETLVKKGIEIHNDVDILEVSGKNGKKVTIKTKTVDKPDSKEVIYKADGLLVATGRKPNTENLKLNVAGVELGPRGHVNINEHMQTTNKNIYALGDVKGLSPFAHTAKREAKLILDNALNNEKHTLNYDIIPWACFTFPTIGGVGMSEKQAKDKGHDVGILRAEFKKAGKAKIIKEDEGFVKVIYDKKNRHLLGCVIVGPEADNLIHEFALLLNTPDPKIDYIKNTVHVHPTLAEVMEELREVE